MSSDVIRYDAAICDISHGIQYSGVIEKRAFQDSMGKIALGIATNLINRDLIDISVHLTNISMKQRKIESTFAPHK